MLVVGDRLATDMILATRLAALRWPAPTTKQQPTLESVGPVDSSTPIPTPPQQSAPRLNVVSILTTQLHAREGLGTTFLRTLERLSLWALTRYRPVPPSPFLSCISAPPSPAPPTPTPEIAAAAATHPRLQRALDSLVPRLQSLIALWTRPQAPKEATAAHLAWRSPREELSEFWRANEGVARRVVEEAEGLRRHGVVRELEARVEAMRRRVVKDKGQGVIAGPEKA